MGKEKGSSFERSICHTISMWWSKGEYEDGFWRTASSGGRATIRGRKGKSTTNHHGDICATREEAIPFLSLVTLELKRGFSSSSIMDLLDKPKESILQTHEKWFVQAMQSHKLAGSFSWMVIAKRDKRKPLVFLPSDLTYKFHALEQEIEPDLNIRTRIKDEEHDDFLCVDVMTLDHFLERVSPDAIREWHVKRKESLTKNLTVDLTCTGT